MILLSFHATLGVGTVQILIKQKRASKLFPSCFKVPSDKKRFRVYVWCFSVVVVSSLSVAAGFYCACASVNNIWGSAAVCSRAAAPRNKTLKDAVPQSLQINKTVWRSFKTKGGSCCIMPLWRRRLDQSHSQDLFPLHFPPHTTLPHPNLRPPPHSRPTQTTSALLLLIIGGLLTANSNWLGSVGPAGGVAAAGRMEGKVQPRSPQGHCPLQTPPLPRPLFSCY